MGRVPCGEAQPIIPWQLADGNRALRQRITLLDNLRDLRYNIRRMEYVGIRVMNSYEKQARLIRAMAHPTRLRILDILAKEESCVCHLTAILEKRQPCVSQHLMKLREAGLVKDRKEGVIVYYRLSNARIVEAMDVTRELLGATGVATDFPPIPLSPISGCPCPKCMDESYSHK